MSVLAQEAIRGRFDPQFVGTLVSHLHKQAHISADAPLEDIDALIASGIKRRDLLHARQLRELMLA